MSNSATPGRPRVVVVGAGHLGTYHLGKLSVLPEAALVGVVEPDETRRRAAMERFNIRGAAHLSTFAGQADAAIIASPTPTHHPLALAALDLQWHLLVEKPVAATAAAAAEIVDMARQRGRVLQVGHVERFNPAIAAALQVADRPRYIVAERLGPFSGRSADVDVILDLMIHDLDIVASLVPAALQEVRAVGVPVMTADIDMASARLAFTDGTVAQLSAGRASLEPSRKLRLFTVERYVSIDCVSREVKSVRRLPPADGSTWPQISGEMLDVPAGDALALQDAHFIHCIIHGETPLVDGEAGLRALRLAEAVRAALTIPYPDGPERLDGADALIAPHPRG